MTRRVIETRAVSSEHEPLIVITIFAEGENKETIKKESIFSKRHAVLVKRNNRFEFK